MGEENMQPADYAKSIHLKNSCCHNSVLTSHEVYVSLLKEINLILNHRHGIKNRNSQFSAFSSGTLHRSSKAKCTGQVTGKETEQDS